jgi:hypothetical protein
MAQSVERLTTGCTTERSRVQVLEGVRFSPLQVIWTDSGSKGNGSYFPDGVKWTGLDADHSLSTNAEVENMLFYTSTPPYIFID